jgi:hypothetical protein
MNFASHWVKGGNLKNLFLLWPLESLKLTQESSLLAEKTPLGFWLHNRALPRRGKVVGGEVGPGVTNKQGG